MTIAASSFPAPQSARPLHQVLARALADGGDALGDLSHASPQDRRDELLTLGTILDLHVGPVHDLTGPVRHQHHPAIAALKGRLEQRYLDRLRRHDVAPGLDPAGDVVAAMRALAAEDRVPPVYEWAASQATYEELADFLALEGGPDGGFDDLVAAAQIGLDGAPKLEMAQNYWDEMGRGAPGLVHTELHRQMADALGLPALRPVDLPIAALRRSMLCGVLATNRHLQPHMVGALGLIELQAGPRCRKVAEGLRRVGAPEEALPFYEEHETTDPRHGKDWLDHVVAPLAERPGWGAAILEGARWRAIVNARFLDAVDRTVSQSQTALAA